MNKDIETILLDLLIKLDEICKKHGLRYYLAYGTCLGAVRHKGFIPWDHDADVLMPIEDAKKLVNYQSEFGKKYFVQCKETDPSFGSVIFRLLDTETTIITDDCGQIETTGISLDIYPFYDCPKSNLGLLINIWCSYVYRVLVNNKPLKNKHSFILRILNLVLLKLSDKNKQGFIKKLENRLIHISGDKILDYYGEDISLFNAITYDKDWFAEPSNLEFEGHSFCGPTEPELYLTERYGDFMKLPPIEKQINPFEKPGVFVDLNKGYREYIKEKNNV